MRSSRVFHAVDSHTEGMPTRVITGGVGVVPGATMSDRRRYFIEHLDHIRKFLMNEPRGHAAMSGAILQPPTRPDADHGVLYIETSGCLPMCGHGTIGVATVLVETGMVEVTEPVTTIRLDTPAGLVVAQVRVTDGVATSVVLRNVPSFVLGLDRTVRVEPWGDIPYDLAYGGNFYAIVQLGKLGIPFARTEKRRILDAGLAIMAAVNDQARPVHPLNPEINGCHHVYLAAPGSDARHSRHAMVIHPGMFDRSPCGTGTSARMAQLHARGELALDTDFDNESFIGTHFTGRLVEEGVLGVLGVPDEPGQGAPRGPEEPRGLTAVIPTIEGRAWITGTAQYHYDPDDPFPEGFEL
ncbi:proline racemase family protein [Streptomyces sp. NPDC094034]|uniref:proline racemase family protein n=1 Tax=Streptomyces sp. NPDC094034 TaxID=3155309 RepID=UPI003333B081